MTLEEFIRQHPDELREALSDLDEATRLEMAVCANDEAALGNVLSSYLAKWIEDYYSEEPAHFDERDEEIAERARRRRVEEENSRW